MVPWIIISIIIIALIVFREPNVESVGALIQESVAKDEAPTNPIDIILVILLLSYMLLTMNLIDGQT